MLRFIVRFNLFVRPPGAMAMAGVYPAPGIGNGIPTSRNPQILHVSVSRGLPRVVRGLRGNVQGM